MCYFLPFIEKKHRVLTLFSDVLHYSGRNKFLLLYYFRVKIQWPFPALFSGDLLTPADPWPGSVHEKKNIVFKNQHEIPPK